MKSRLDLAESFGTPMRFPRWELTAVRFIPVGGDPAFTWNLSDSWGEIGPLPVSYWLGPDDTAKSVLTIHCAGEDYRYYLEAPGVLTAGSEFTIFQVSGAEAHPLELLFQVVTTSGEKTEYLYATSEHPVLEPAPNLFS